MQQCHEKYGDYVRYAPNRLLINSPSAAKTIYTYSPDFQKSQVYNVMVHRAPNTLTHIDKKGHGRKRRIVSQGLSDAAVRSYEPTIIHHINKMCDIWAQKDKNTENEKDNQASSWSPPHNIARWTNYLTFDIMSAVVFGEAFHLLTTPDNRFVPEAIEASNVRTSVLVQAQKLTFRRLDRKLFRHAIAGRNRFIGFINTLLKSRLAAKPLTRNDAFSFLLKARDPETGEKLSPAELGAEATTLVVAGSDTTSTALAALFFYLAHHPSARARATGEIRAAFPTRDTPVKLGAELTSCTFLAACIDESLRLVPPAATAPWREVVNPITLDGTHHIPAGVDVGTCTYALHHRSDAFPEPYEFKPERWLGENRTPEALASFAPFSMGPRSCVGKGLARAELALAVAMVLRRFEFETAGGFEGVGCGGDGGKDGKGWRGRVGEYQVRDHITCAKDGPVVRFREWEGGEEGENGEGEGGGEGEEGGKKVDAMIEGGEKVNGVVGGGEKSNGVVEEGAASEKAEKT
ncbi:hypothetical protein MMC10_002643 [Thelotrema lepadinum]|nr:hypothetical protein [Thelotrema lepadinum]